MYKIGTWSKQYDTIDSRAFDRYINSKRVIHIRELYEVCSDLPLSLSEWIWLLEILHKDDEVFVIYIIIIIRLIVKL